MAITWRAVVLTALGVVPVLLVPVTLVILAWALLVVLACSVDVALAASPRLLAVQRNVPPSVRLTEQTRSTLTVTNRSGRRLRALVRDAWQPSAGATSNRHPVDLPDAESRRLVTPLRPTRRGDRYADRVTVRSFGPMRLAARQVSLNVPGRLRVLPALASRPPAGEVGARWDRGQHAQPTRDVQAALRGGGPHRAEGAHSHPVRVPVTPARRAQRRHQAP